MLWSVSLFFFFIVVVMQALWQRNYSRVSLLPETFPPTLSYLIALMPLSLIVGLIMPHHVTWSTWLIFLIVVEGGFIGVFNWLMFVALRLLPVAKFEMIFQLYTIVVVVLGWVLLGEKLTTPQIIGGIVLFIAAYIAISAPRQNKSQLRKHANKKGVLITLLAALTLGIGLVTEKAALNHMDTGAYFIFGFLSQTIALVILASKDVTKETISRIKIEDIKQSTVMGILSALVGFTYIISIQLSNNISLVTMLSSFTLPLMVLAGYVFLHERENMTRLWIASGLGCAGLILAAL